MFIRIVVLLWYALPTAVLAQETVQFASLDGLPVTADLYLTNDSAQFIVLCHLAGHSRGEYRETAKRFNDLGFNCLALDARSGKEVFGVINETNLAAKKANKSTNPIDSEPDIRAAVDYAYNFFGKPVILLGSSYSASLVLLVATDHPNVSKVVAFSPGEYFDGSPPVREKIKSLTKPVFVTSSRNEASAVKELVSKINSVRVEQFVPKAAGAHGSIALWQMTEGYQEYWEALIAFVRRQN